MTKLVIIMGLIPGVLSANGLPWKRGWMLGILPIFMKSKCRDWVGFWYRNM